MEIKDLAAIVTGGASGLGAATARRLAAGGAKVAIFDADETAAQRLAAEIGALACKVDVTREEDVAQAFQAAEGAHGVARLLVNCAGLCPIERVVRTDGAPHAASLFRKVVEVNLTGTFLTLAAVAARLAQVEPLGEERGVIVNTASIAAFDGQVGQTAYAASKAGIVGMTLAAARDLAPHRIRVVTIAPGMFRTPMIDMLSEEAKDRLGQQAPFHNRLGRPEEFADLVLGIVGNPMLNGEVIRLDAAHRL